MLAQRCVLFDFDNTLANTEALREIRETQQYDRLTIEVLSTITLYRPVEEILSTLHANGVTMGIVTNSGATYVHVLLAHLGIAHYFGAVVTYTDVKFSGMKPSPAGIKLALDRLGMHASKEVLFVGDTNLDIEAAYAAGVTPILPSWASKEPTSMAPAMEFSSTQLRAYFVDHHEFKLFAERAAEVGSIEFNRKGTYFLPLDDHANVVTMENEITTLCLGRYFSQKSAVSAALHDGHALSKGIFAKEEKPVFDIPKYWIDMIAHAVKRGGESKITGAMGFDVVTVIPAKRGKDARLERLLASVGQILANQGSNAAFIGDIFVYSVDAQSQKGLPRNLRHNEANRSLHLSKDRAALVAGKRILIIDDVITTGATLQRARSLAIASGASAAFCLAIAKTVSLTAQEKDCTKCGLPMSLRRNSSNKQRFWSCSGYSNETCTHTEPLYVKKCPRCARDMRLFTNKTSNKQFWSCTGYRSTPQCNFTTNFVSEEAA